MAQKTWLITGCSSGLGKTLVEQILRRGDLAVATAENVSTLENLAEAGAVTIELDITSSEEILKEKVTEAIQACGHIDVIVHNAGSFQMGPCEDLTHELLQKQFHTNLFGPVNLTRAIIPHFRERKSGNIVFINSTAAWQTYAGVSAYGGSKAALEDGLAREVGPFGVRTLTIDAGAFRSQLNANAVNHRQPSQHYEQLMDAIEGYMKWLTDNAIGDPVKLANLIIDLVKGEGIGAGKEISPTYPKPLDQMFQEWRDMSPGDIPLTLPAGSDAIETMKANCEAMLNVIGQWESVIRSTDAKPSS